MIQEIETTSSVIFGSTSPTPVELNYSQTIDIAELLTESTIKSGDVFLEVYAYDTNGTKVISQTPIVIVSDAWSAAGISGIIFGAGIGVGMLLLFAVIKSRQNKATKHKSSRSGRSSYRRGSSRSSSSRKGTSRRSGSNSSGCRINPKGKR